MEFLLNVKINWPIDMDPNVKEAIIHEQQELIGKFAQRGHLARMWCIPGRRESWGLWKARDATHLHETLSALPVFPYMDVNRYPLAVHPVDPMRQELERASV